MIVKNQKRVYHPGEVLRIDWVEPLSMNLRSLSMLLDMSETELNLFLNGKMPLTYKLAVSLAKWFCTTEGYWIKLQDAYNKKVSS
jgi:antitoxin HigA-1